MSFVPLCNSKMSKTNFHYFFLKKYFLFTPEPSCKLQFQLSGKKKLKPCQSCISSSSLKTKKSKYTKLATLPNHVNNNEKTIQTKT